MVGQSRMGDHILLDEEGVVGFGEGRMGAEGQNRVEQVDLAGVEPAGVQNDRQILVGQQYSRG